MGWPLPRVIERFRGKDLRKQREANNDDNCNNDKEDDEWEDVKKACRLSAPALCQQPNPAFFALA
jgi:hypothetical protein